MITIESNTSRILHNPSRRCEGFGAKCQQIRLVVPHFIESFSNPSRGRVKDLRGRKSIYNKYISLSFINTSRVHARARALRVRTREGVCEVFVRRIRPASPVQQCTPLRPRLHTFAHVGESGIVAPTFPSRAPTQHAATRWPTCGHDVYREQLRSTNPMNTNRGY